MGCQNSKPTKFRINPGTVNPQNLKKLGIENLRATIDDAAKAVNDTAAELADAKERLAKRCAACRGKGGGSDDIAKYTYDKSHNKEPPQDRERPTPMRLFAALAPPALAASCSAIHNEALCECILGCDVFGADSTECSGIVDPVARSELVRAKTLSAAAKDPTRCVGMQCMM